MIGVEVEFEADRDEVSRWLSKSNPMGERKMAGRGAPHYWTQTFGCLGWRLGFDPSIVKYDGVDPERSCEIVSPPLPASTVSMWRLFERLPGATITPSCGVHVHIDADKWTDEELVALVESVIADPPVVSSKRQRFNKLPHAFLARVRSGVPLREAWFGKPVKKVGHYDRSRHHAVNLQSVFYRGTIEFRWFEGSLDADVIQSYVDEVLERCARVR